MTITINLGTILSILSSVVMASGNTTSSQGFNTANQTLVKTAPSTITIMMARDRATILTSVEEVVTSTIGEEGE